MENLNPGHNSIDNIELEIGGQLIDRQYGHWMEAWVELTEPNDAALVRDEVAPLSMMELNFKI